MFKISNIKFSAEHLFMISVLFVNLGNYIYNLLLGRLLGPSQFADAALLITFILVLSFVAMTFQLVTAKFTVIFEADLLDNFISKIYKKGVVIGLLLGMIIVLFSNQLTAYFNTQTNTMFVIFGISIPIYFIMSINRGFLQGNQQFKKLGITYQIEMLSKLIVTFLLIYTFKIDPTILIAFAIIISFSFGLIYTDFKSIFKKNTQKLNKYNTKTIQSFFVLTAMYECSQIIINNSDILLVKHFFNDYNAGLYAALSLIGRVVYFISWMFIMILFPKIITLKKAGKSTFTLVIKNVIYISLLGATTVIFCWLFPDFTINILFGEKFLDISHLLWKYALATAIFSVANVFAYYYLSVEKYTPIIISILVGLLQIFLIYFHHTSLNQVIQIQLIVMLLLLLFQVVFFFYESKIKKII